MKNILNPQFITGFIDAEGCFHVSIVSNDTLKVGKSVRVMFQISLHEKDKALLESIRDYFNIGKVINRKDGVFYYQISSASELLELFNHFDSYPLITQKKADYLLFKSIVELILNKEHLTSEG